MKPNILIVEDDAALARILSDNLVADGFDVSCIFDGDAAITRASGAEPDLVILDVTLPGSTGFEVCRAFRRRGGTPIFMLTARITATDRTEAFAAGADAYISKPFDLESLLSRVRERVWTRPDAAPIAGVPAPAIGGSPV